MRFADCFIELAGDRLYAGNDHFRRTWRVDPSGLLYATSFQDTASGEWLASPSAQAAPLPPDPLPDEARSLVLQALPNPLAVSAPCLTADLVATGAQVTLRYMLQVFPHCRGVRMRLIATGEGGTNGATTDKAAPAADAPTGVETDTAPPPALPDRDTDTLDALRLAPPHLRLTQVILQDQTDQHNELVFENEWLLHPSEGTLRLPGCLFYVEDTLTGAGLIFVKEAPLPYARPVPSVYDLRVGSSERSVVFAGHGAEAGQAGYAFATLAYTGGATGRIAAIHQYQRCLRPYQPTRDGLLVSNTWGDRNRDGRINAAFMAREVEAGARLGVDVIQIDDGWQAGVTSNSVNAATGGGVWEGFYAARDSFWETHPTRFPDGLLPLIDAARERGMRFGLWFGPDSAGDFAHWERDADTILGLRRDLGVTYIKIDGVKVRSKIGERNLNAFFDRVLRESGGEMVFDLDVTAEVRPAYFGMVEVGPLFVENRYTDWHKYWPHQTLRNLWKLARHIDPVRLRMEWLNHARHTELYDGDPLAPQTYRPDYLFATVMFASPLGWFEVSSLPDSYFAEAAPLIAVWKAHREAIFGGTIYPIGAAPDGVAWTGFVSVAADRRSAYLLVFREAAPHSQWQTPLALLPDVSAPTSTQTLGGDGDATLLPGGYLSVNIPATHRFLLAHLRL